MNWKINCVEYKKYKAFTGCLNINRNIPDPKKSFDKWLIEVKKFNPKDL